MNKKTHSTKSENWRHASNSVEIAWTTEQKADLKWLWRHMVVTKNLDDEIKNIARRNPEATRSIKTTKKTLIAAEAITFCTKPLTSYLPRSDLKIGET